MCGRARRSRAQPEAPGGQASPARPNSGSSLSQVAGACISQVGRWGAVPAFGKSWMLFRVLFMNGVAINTVGLGGGGGSGVRRKRPAGAHSVRAQQTINHAERGTTFEWRRSGPDGKDGTAPYHEADSRAHRFKREVGFVASNQAEIDADAVAGQAHAFLNRDFCKIKSHVDRVADWARIERYILEFHSGSEYAKYLLKLEHTPPDGEKVLWQALRTRALLPSLLPWPYPTPCHTGAPRAPRHLGDRLSALRLPACG